VRPRRQISWETETVVAKELEVLPSHHNATSEWENQRGKLLTPGRTFMDTFPFGGR